MSTPVTIVIFGASGDLTQRKLIPALFNLYRKGRLPGSFDIVGFSRRDYTHDAFRAHLLDGLRQFAPGDFAPGVWDEFAAHIWYAPGNIDDPAAFVRLKALLDEVENGPAAHLYYLATAPRFFSVVAEQLSLSGLAQHETLTRRLVVEKPFGHDLSSAHALNRALHAVFEEDQIYRIDHYLGKETAQNILFFRFANTLFELGWNRNYIDHVQITVAEQVDVKHRAGYYDQSGVLRDMFQNHLVQLLALTAMEPPVSFDADAIRNEKAKLFSALRPITVETLIEHTICAQYEGYCEAPGVAENSRTPTYAALKLYIDNWRWQGVPFYLRSGKALAQKATQIVIQFRRPPHLLFPLPPGQTIEGDTLSLCIQPHEGMHFTFQAKVPDTITEMRAVDMSFHYDDTFGAASIPDAYERLLLDAISGDASLFTRSDGIENAWRFIDPIIQGWESDLAPPLVLYAPGSWGPAAADDLMVRDGRKWLHGCDDHA